MKISKVCRWDIFLVTSIVISTLGNVNAALNESCTVNVLNRVLQVQKDGSWAMPNVPSNMGQIRARVTCLKNGVTTSGQTGYFTVVANGLTNTGDFIFGNADPVPQSLSVTPAGQILIDQANPAQQLAVTAAYSDGSSADVSLAASGTNYASSNPVIATVSADGLLKGVGYISSGWRVLKGVGYISSGWGFLWPAAFSLSQSGRKCLFDFFSEAIIAGRQAGIDAVADTFYV